MSLPEYVTPVLAIGGPVALIYVSIRFGLDALGRLIYALSALIAVIVAVATRDREKRGSAQKVLRMLLNGDTPRQVGRRRHLKLFLFTAGQVSPRTDLRLTQERQ